MALQVQIGEQKLDQEQLLSLLAKYQLLPRLAQEMIIDQAIATTPDLSCTQEEVKAAINLFVQQRQLKSEADIQNWLKKNGLAFDQLPAIASRPILLEKFKQQRWGDNLESYFVQRKSQLDRIIYSLLRTNDAGVAQELYFRILDDASLFPELAREYSKGPESQTGGLVGPVEMNVPHPAMIQILSSSQPGELKPPVKIGEWFVILRLEKSIPAQLDETMQQRLINEQFEQWLNQQVQEQLLIEHLE
ncbi:peptidylprolyl isomerase [[Limnothrix rosea] IAM M-220]|uniref:peptidylprolyl isomerase n=1 Tax=[Limnothrix rosea] IAM M-220 TaxID=454133 RepID=UPI0009668498|nr:peptidylprolyl isomerase [[Limnothrix rosea] IAM M-220]OKH14578.1 peptidylprolyl isomerase [[Limnothrix rosea] IAM M-220]